MSLDQRLARQLDELQSRDALRAPPCISERDGPRYKLDGRPVVGFCTNDYLGWAHEERPGTAGPTGSGASRLICGDLPEHREVEAQIAQLMGTPDAVLFPSGFQLNVGVLPALVDPSDIAYSDRLNHASLIDGLRLAPGHVEILDHLQAPPISGPGRWWVTESIFSMDGDRADLAALAQHRAAGGMTYVDEAHAFGLFGAGRGLCSNTDAADVIVGTLSKAYGCAGAFAAGSESLADWIRNRARSYIFSTGPTPRLLPDLRQAIDALSGAEGDRRRNKLWENVRTFAQALELSDAPSSPVVPIVVGPNDATLKIAEQLVQRGWHVQAIRPPTVPTGTARLRVTLSAMHTSDMIEGLVRDLRELFEAANRPLRVGVAA